MDEIKKLLEGLTGAVSSLSERIGKLEAAPAHAPVPAPAPKADVPMPQKGPRVATTVGMYCSNDKCPKAESCLRHRSKFKPFAVNDGAVNATPLMVTEPQALSEFKPDAQGFCLFYEGIQKS